MKPTPASPAAGPAAGVPVAIGLGTNLGDRRGYLRRAMSGLARSISDRRCSSIWASDAMLLPGSPPSWAIPYLNAVVVGRTTLGPLALLDALQRIELDLGRGPHEKWAPRPIDLDLLLYGDREIDDARLTVPHPGLRSRPFVLLPLAELWPETRLPGEPRPLAELAVEYRAAHAHGLPFSAHIARDEPPLAVGA